VIKNTTIDHNTHGPGHCPCKTAKALPISNNHANLLIKKIPVQTVWKKLSEFGLIGLVDFWMPGI